MMFEDSITILIVELMVRVTIILRNRSIQTATITIPSFDKEDERSFISKSRQFSPIYLISMDLMASRCDRSALVVKEQGSLKKPHNPKKRRRAIIHRYLQ